MLLTSHSKYSWRSKNRALLITVPPQILFNGTYPTFITVIISQQKFNPPHLSGADKELGAVGVGSGVGHGQDPGPRVAELQQNMSTRFYRSTAFSL